MTDRWCPACRTPWPGDREVCGTCLAELVDDPDATVTCPQCGRAWPFARDTCGGCLAELHPTPPVDVDDDALVDALAAGRRLWRPRHLPAFRDGGQCTVERLRRNGSLMVTGPDGLIEAAVRSPGRKACPPLVCADAAGATVVTIDRYDPSDRGLVALAPDGAALATYVPESWTSMTVHVRDDASAPVGRLEHVAGGWALVETGGADIARCDPEDVDLDGWVDDAWTIRLLPAAGGRHPFPLRPLALAGLAVVAKVLFGRAAPEPPTEQR